MSCNFVFYFFSIWTGEGASVYLLIADHRTKLGLERGDKEDIFVMDNEENEMCLRI